MTQDPFAKPPVAAYSHMLAESFRHWTGRDLILGPDLPRALFYAPFPVVSHGAEADPVFRYANNAALALWGMDWDAFTRLPSRLSAESVPGVQDDRSALLRAALEKGWIEDYSGIRISARGERFAISDTILWTVRDANGLRLGQAARIGAWAYV